MKANIGRSYRWPALIAGALAGCLLPCAFARAQGGNNGYRTDERGRSERDRFSSNTGSQRNGSADQVASTAFTNEGSDTDNQNVGPVRMARFSHVSGSVTWRSDDKAEWTKATVNLPMREGSQIWVTNGGHADVQFDDGSELRLGNGALATIKTMFSDKDGEFTQISLNDGLATLRARHDNAVYQVDTPAASVKSKGAAQIRFGVDNGSEITVQHGEALAEGPNGKADLHAGDYLYLADSNSPFKIKPAPLADSWDKWNEDRNRLLDGKSGGHVPSNIALVSGELDSYGSWRTNPTYGSVWYPRNTASDWRPYNDGHWTWCDPFGWTWVSNEPWGWAPYHYGTWIHESYGWGWCPGPWHQYWSPGVVHFSVYDGCVAWAPLCPYEVHYPYAASFGYWGSNWALSFSIGSCGVYYPSGGYCVGRSWNNDFVNGFDTFRDGGRFNRAFNDPSFNRYSRSNEFAAANSHFIPYNASRASGASFARKDAFGGTGRYQPLSATNTSYFTRGRQAALPAAGGSPVGGPPSVGPTALGRTPTRSFIQSGLPPASALKRPVYQSATPLAGGSVSRANTGGRGATSGDGAASIFRSRGSSGFETSRVESGEGRVPRQPSGISRSQGNPPVRNQSPIFGGPQARSGDTIIGAAEAARRARSSLGYSGASSASATRDYGSSSRTIPGGRTDSSSNSRTPIDSGIGRSYGGSSGRLPSDSGVGRSYGGSSGRLPSDSGVGRSYGGSSGRSPSDSGGGRTYGGPSGRAPSDSGGGRTYGGSGGRTPGDSGGGRSSGDSGGSRSSGGSNSRPSGGDSGGSRSSGDSGGGGGNTNRGRGR